MAYDGENKRLAKWGQMSPRKKFNASLVRCVGIGAGFRAWNIMCIFG
jgi:hypothetical protein